MGKIMLIVVLVLLVLAIAQIMRVYELSSKVRGSSEATVTRRDNNLNAVLMLVFMFAFFGFVIWQMIAFGNGDKGPAVSIHGQVTDWLINLNFGIIIPVFFICNALLFYFAFKYGYRKRGEERKALYYPHNNKLEMLWTVTPAIVLAIIIVLGLQTWNDITDLSGDFVVQEHSNLKLVEDENGNQRVVTEFEVAQAFTHADGAGAYLSKAGGDYKNVLVEKGGVWVLQQYDLSSDTLTINEKRRFATRNDALMAIYNDSTMNAFTELKEQKHIELYSKQFDWTTRYAGKDNKLGDANFKLIDYGLGSDMGVGDILLGDDTISSFVNPLGLISTETVMLHMARIDSTIEAISEKLEAEAKYTPDERVAELTENMERLKRKKMRIQSTIANNIMMFDSVASEINSSVYDDIVVKGDLHLVVGQPYQFQFKAQDVIHSAYFPHFRAQMNCVPGMATQFKFTPTMTTKDFQKHPQVVNKYKHINKLRRDAGKPPVEAGYLLLCNKICGLSHSKMWINVIVETQEEYDAWMAEQKTFKDQLREANLVD